MKISTFKVLLSLAVLLSTSFSYTVYGQAKKVAYINLAGKTMAEGASSLDNDPIIRMLKADTKFEVTVMLVAADATIDGLDAYDVVVVQECFGSTSAIFKPGASLGIASIPVPFVYNKMYAMRDTRGFTSGASGSGGEVAGTYHLRVSAANQSNELFNGMTFVGDSVQIFLTGADDSGGTTGTKGLQYAAGVEISATGTLLGSGVNDPENATVSFNDIPAGTMIGSETTKARMIALGHNTGAINKDGGDNLTRDGLTLWRNAIYSLAGLTVPATTANPTTDVVDLVAGTEVSLYPNPLIVGELAKVRFQIDGQSEVRLSLFNMIGQKIDMTEIQVFEQGENELDLPVADLGEGMYIYRLEIGSKVHSGKFTVTK